MTKTKKSELSPEKKTTIVAEKGKVHKKKPKTKAKAVKKNATSKEIVVEPTTTTLTERDKLKIEKKKTKKLAQKLKKKLRKQKLAEEQQTNGTENNKENNETTQNDAKPVKTKKQKKAEKKKQTSEDKLKEQKTPVKKAKLKKIEKKDKEPKERDPADKAATVFVGNLPTNTKLVQLDRLFKDVGVPKSKRLRTAGGKILYKHKQRKSAVSLNAYVVFDSPDLVEKALLLNGTEFKGNTLRVTRTGEEAVTAANDAVKRTIFVGNLKYTATEDKLREIFSCCGDIEYIRCLQDSEKGCKGVAYVCFKNADAVGLALELKETILDERAINVERYSIKKLGAKAARDSAAAASVPTKKKINKTGAQKRIAKKQQKPNDASERTDPIKKKKSEFRGVKSDGLKKTNKKKKVSGALQKLAKKIAPKAQ